jgi:hypothetical protein
LYGFFEVSRTFLVKRACWLGLRQGLFHKALKVLLAFVSGLCL